MTGAAIHAIVFVVVNLLLLALWVFGGGEAGEIPNHLTHWSQARSKGFWPLYVLVLWGAAVAIHLGVVFVTLPKQWREARARRRSRENVQRTVLKVLDGTMLEGAAMAAIRATDGDKAAKRVKRQVRSARRADMKHRVMLGTESPTAGSGPRSRKPPEPGAAPPAPEPRSARAKAGSARHWVAVMFTDLVDSTRLNNQLGDDAWAAVLKSHREFVRGRIDRHGGTEVGTQGDGFLIRFADPDAAVACAIDLQRTSAKRRARVPDTARLRVGIHAGEVVHDGDDDDLVGRVVNLAARVTDVASPDEILVTEAVTDHLTSPTAITDRGLHQLKGIDRPRHLLAIVWADAPAVVDLDAPISESS